MASATVSREELAPAAGEDRGEGLTVLSNEPVRVTVNLPETLAVDLRALAEEQGKTFTQALKEAIALKLYIDRAVSGGATVLLEQAGRPVRELVLQV